MEEINESGAAPEESKNQTGTGGIRKKAKHLARKTAEDWTARDVGTYASSIAFFFFMSMIPLLIIIFQLLPIFGLSQVDLIKFLDRLMPEAMQGFAAIVVSQAYRYSMGTLSLSVVTHVWSASKGTMALRQGLWCGRDPPLSGAGAACDRVYGSASGDVCPDALSVDCPFPFLNHAIPLFRLCISLPFSEERWSEPINGFRI